MSVETALEQLLQMLRRRALNLVTTPEDERDWQYDRIRLSCCGAAEQIGQSPDEAAITASRMVEFTRAMVGIIERGRRAQVREEGEASSKRTASGAPAADALQQTPPDGPVIMITSYGETKRNALGQRHRLHTSATYCVRRPQLGLPAPYRHLRLRMTSGLPNKTTVLKACKLLDGGPNRPPAPPTLLPLDLAQHGEIVDIWLIVE